MVNAGPGVEVGVELQETGGGGEAAVLEAAMVAAEEAPWGEVEEGTLVVASVDVAGVVTSGSGNRTSERFTPLNSRRRRMALSPSSTLKKITHPNSLFVRFFDLIRSLFLTVSS